jgi:uncharacterized protein
MTTIKVSNIPEEGLRLRFRFDGEKLKDIIKMDRGMDFHPHGIDLSCDIVKVQETVNIELHLATEIGFDCCRCLDAFTMPVKSDARYTLVPFRDDVRGEGEWSGEDDAFGFYREDLIDLETLIYEQILLQIPIKPICREDCRGLCPRCGANMNLSSCSCRQDRAESTFAALKDMKVKK